jgi:hypothetical protein
MGSVCGGFAGGAAEWVRALRNDAIETYVCGEKHVSWFHANDGDTDNR